MTTATKGRDSSKDYYHPLLLLVTISISTLSIILSTKFSAFLYIAIIANVSLVFSLSKIKKETKAKQTLVDFIFDNIPIGIVLTRSGKVQQCFTNKYFSSFTTASQNDESKIVSLLPLESDEFKDPIEKKIQQNDGTETWIKIETSQSQQEHGILVHFVSDITKIKEIEINFAKKDTQMQFIFNSTPIGLHWSHDREQKIQGPVKDRLFNLAHQEITELSNEDINTPGIFSAITHPEDRLMQDNARTRLRTKETNRVSLEKRYIQKDGRIKWVSAAWARKWDKDGVGYQEVNTMVDITKLKETSENLRRKERHFRFIFESAPIGMLWSYAECKPDGKGVKFLERLVNPAHLKITGLSAKESETPNFFETISDSNDLKIQKAGIEKHLKNGDGFFSMEKRYVRKSGEVRWVSISWLRKWEIPSKTYHELSTLVDITEQKRITEEVIKAKTAAESANKAKSQFLSTMSHEIRTPMNGLIGVLHIMESNASTENRKLLGIAQTSAKELLTLINDVLDFSKIEAGKIELENKQFPIDELIEKSVEAQFNQANEKGLELRCKIPPKAAIEFTGDLHRLKQVVTNLLNNAIKFTASGEVEVGTQLLNEEKIIEIYVKDTGIGIKPENQKKLFTAFTQANTSTTRKYGGTGLGLSICKSIVEKMGGKIGISSKENSGSKFWIQIPLIENNPINFGDQEYNKNQKALIVLESPDTAQYLKTWLNNWNCSCHVTNDYLDIANNINTMDSKNNYDLIIIDSTILQLEKEKWKSLFQENTNLKNTKRVLLNRATNKDEETPSYFNQSIAYPPKIRQIYAALSNNSSETDSENKTKKPSIETLDLSQSKILLVDDNTINRTVTSKLLQIKANITSDLACNGLEAIEALKVKKYDVVFMDCMMPEMDGYEATKAIREGVAGQLNQDIPILALTANAMKGDREKCLDSGMDDHLTKPINPIMLNSLLKHWIGKRHQPSPPIKSKHAESNIDKTIKAPELLKIEVLKEIFEGDIKTVKDALNIFIESSLENIESLKQAIEAERNFERIIFITHQMTGESAEVGAEALKTAALELEELCSNKMEKQVTAKYKELIEISEKTIEQITKKIQNNDF